MVKASHGRTVVSLPTLTKVADHTKRTECPACVDAYQTLPYPTPVMLKHMVDLVWSTNCYQASDLAPILPRATFTNTPPPLEGITHSDDTMCYVVLL